MNAKRHLFRRLCALLLALPLASACDADAENEDTPPTEDPLAPGKADHGGFDHRLIMMNGFFADAGAMTPRQVQTFLEDTPYGTRCWLADESIAGRPASEVIVDIAGSRDLNPMLLVARMQVEASLISKVNRPSQTTIDHALGCGCPDGAGCSSGTAGLERQLTCAADVLRDSFDASEDGTGRWRAGHAEITLDHKRVTPVNSATAAHYAYTPWVLQGTGGNWLVWSVLSLFRHHAQDQGVVFD